MPGYTTAIELEAERERLMRSFLDLARAIVQLRAAGVARTDRRFVQHRAAILAVFDILVQLEEQIPAALAREAAFYAWWRGLSLVSLPFYLLTSYDEKTANND
jgi:hypothetical protein